MNIRKSMYVTVSILIMLPVLLFSLIVLRINNQRLETAIEDSLQAVANAQIEEMTTFCEQQMSELTVLGKSEVFQAALRGELDESTLNYVNNILYSHVNMVDYLESSALIDTKNHVVACSEETYEAEAQEGFDMFVNHIGEDGFYISNVLTSVGGEEPREAVMAIARIDDEDETLGYILLEISLDFYSSIRKQAKIWNGSTFYLLDGNGQIISAGTAEDDRDSFITSKKDRKDYNEKYNAIDFDKNPQGSFGFELGGKKYITYYSDIDYTKWQVMLTVNLDDYTAETPIYILLTGFIILIAVLVAMWLGSFTSRRILTPFDRISDTLADIRRKEDYSLRIQVDREDEIGELSREINDLLEFIETENLDKQQKQRILKEKAEYDSLTKVMNKGKIEQYMTRAFESCRERRGRMAVLFADIDDFKSFNTLYGHNVGDQILQYFAKLLVLNIDGAVGRLGGDEFLIVIEKEEELNNLPSHLERVKTQRTGKFVLRGGGQVEVNCCVGGIYVDFAVDGMDKVMPQQVIDRADILMYRTKNHGKGGYLLEEYAIDGE